MDLERFEDALFAFLDDDGTFPNSVLPVYVLPGALARGRGGFAGEFERLFADNGWPPAWRDGIFGYHHYHSTAHEGLGVARGSIRVLLGGDGGIEVSARPGDCIVIPAGVAHKRLDTSADLLIVGAYPGGTSPDMLYGKPGERPAADRRIAAVPLPSQDPVRGREGPLARLWLSPPPRRRD